MNRPVRNSNTQSKPAAGLLELDNFSIRGLRAGDLPAVRSLAESTPAGVFELPVTDRAFQAFAGGLAKKPWSLPFLCFQDGRPVGMCLMSIAQVKNLNAYLVALFSVPAEATLPLAMYIRHAFWSFPLHRLYAQLPATAAVIPHVNILERAGFQLEGMFAGHVASAEGPQDAIVVGLLRDEFNVWCEQNEPRLALS
jgi:RimJ/RimL family protein N-acetyltransferase